MNAASKADQAEPFRNIYWSAIYIERESQRLEREYQRLLNHLTLWRSLEKPVTRHRTK